MIRGKGWDGEIIKATLEADFKIKVNKYLEQWAEGTDRISWTDTEARVLTGFGEITDASVSIQIRGGVSQTSKL